LGALQPLRASRVGYIKRACQCFLGYVYWLQGEPDAAWESLQRYAETMSLPTDVLLETMYRLVMGSLLYEQNALEDAAPNYQYLIDHAWFPLNLAIGKLGLANIRLAQGQSAEAFQLVAGALPGVTGLGVGAEVFIRILQAHFWARHDRRADALQWAEAYDRDHAVVDANAYNRVFGAVVRAAIAQATGDGVRARNVLLAEKATAARNGWTYLLVFILTQIALVEDALNGQDAALAALREALELAAPRRFLRIFLDVGAPMRQLLARFARANSERDAAFAFVTLLQAAFGAMPERTQGAKPPPATPRGRAAKQRILTRRELDVLRQIATGASNEVIASRLVIAQGTVKRHMSNIFNKLSVSNRTQALTLALAQGMLDFRVG
jgi:LuxR family maltose regulon positive regulatory protein